MIKIIGTFPHEGLFLLRSVQTIAFNLPNDERVRKEKGAKKVKGGHKCCGLNLYGNPFFANIAIRNVQALKTL